MIAMGVAGAAQVAAIASQKFQPSGTSGGTARSPRFNMQEHLNHKHQQFNIVGQSGFNQVDAGDRPTATRSSICSSARRNNSTAIRKQHNFYCNSRRIKQIKMEIVELILDEENEEMTGIEAVSIVESPAIQSDFIALSDQEIKLAKVDDEKRIVMGAALIPNKPIFRKRNETMFYVYFSKDTVRRASELFFQNGNQSNATLEHQMKANGLTVVESWIVEGEQDKSRIYGSDAPVGSWVISMKVEDDRNMERH